MGLGISRRPRAVPRWEHVPFNLFYAHILSPGESFSVVHVSNRDEIGLSSGIVRIGELEQEIVLAHSCHNPYMKTCVQRSFRGELLCWWMGSVHPVISSSKLRSGENMRGTRRN